MKLTAAIITLSLFAGVFRANAQVLTAGDTLGAGKSAILVSENRLYVDVVDLNIAYVQYVRGLSDRFDLYVSIGETHILGEDQVWFGIGGNLNLMKWRGTSVSLFNVVSTPLHKREQACKALLNSALVVSRNIWRVGVYSGVNSLIPIGNRVTDLFTPPTYKVNVPLGLVVTAGDWAIFTEADIGHLKAVGIGIARAF